MATITKDQFKLIARSTDIYDETLIDVDDHGWSYCQIIVDIDQFCIDNFEVDTAFLGTFWALNVNIEPEWGIQWEHCYEEPYQVEKKEVIKIEWSPVNL